VLYGIIGGGSALVDFLLFTLLYATAGINELIANVISVHAGIAMSFTLNLKYNFKKADKILFRGNAFYLIGLFGLALSGGMLWLGGVLEFPILLVKFVSIFIVAGVQFIMNKLISFK
jgi:putative flippase GtrA